MIKLHSGSGFQDRRKINLRFKMQDTKKQNHAVWFLCSKMQLISLYFDSKSITFAVLFKGIGLLWVRRIPNSESVSGVEKERADTQYKVKDYYIAGPKDPEQRSDFGSGMV